ncbi:hypothetical protein PF011_g10786 [Phytophthora fragariae]|uniref:RXLR phytopathogen effector protein WY-domain domain-containing protein n=1 Tax=Phytophthora fragariae TaxID=53985 RepID=A0A6A3KX33_9STRA|nr:hypothetical protein PF011_g10786 [Phytophthora fragariae]
MSKKPKSEAEVFKLLAKMNLINEKSNVFENPQFLKLTNAVAKGYKEPQAADMAIALTLAGQRGDEALAKMIVEAKKVSSTKDVAVRLEEAQIKNWLSKEETADKVLRALKIEKDGYISLWNLLLGTWVSYVKKIEEDPYKLLLSKMRAHDSDAKIAGWIGNAKQDAVPIAEKLENVLLDSWMPKTADDIFKLLELSSRGNDLFHSPRLSTWISYVTKVKGKQADVQMYTVLRAAYGDDELARMLAASKQFALGDVAKRLEEVQHKLNDGVDDLLTNPLLSNWVTYVEKLNENPYAMLLGKLKTSKLTATDAKLVEMIMKAKKDASTSVIAGKLEAAQLEKWSSEKQTAADVFQLLKLDHEGAVLLWKQRVRAWVAYVTKLDPHKSDDVILSVLKPYYTDTELARMVLTGRDGAEAMAAKFEKIVLNKWLAEKTNAVYTRRSSGF